MGRAAGMFALDIDHPDGPASLAALEAKHGALPLTLSQTTGGGGRQMFFRWPEGREVRNSAGKLGPGLDVRGEGGYVIMPPSVHPSGGVYAWDGGPDTPVVDAPEWFLNLVCAKPAGLKVPAAFPLVSARAAHIRHQQSVTSTSVVPANAWVQAAFEEEVTDVANALVGTRNDRLFRASCALGELVAGGALDHQEVFQALMGAARACGLGEVEAIKAIDGGLGRGRRNPRSGPKRPICGRSVAGAEDNRPVLEVRAGARPMLVDACEQVLLATAQPVYQRGGELVRVVSLPEPHVEGGIRREAGALVLTPVTSAWLCDALGRVASFVKPTKRGELVPCDAPAEAAGALLARAGDWRFPTLRGILAGPAIRADGSVLNTAGYDHETAYYLGAAMPCLEVPQAPGRDDAKSALTLLRDLLGEFPFVEPIDEAVALALMLTSVARTAVFRAPMFTVTSPVRGSGKSLLIDLSALLSTGRPAAVLAAGGGADELDKRLGASLLAGDELVCLDNFNGVLRSDFLCQALTQEKVRLRVLGKPDQRELSCEAIWCANGNNLVLGGDLTRRAVSCRLDPRCERPEQRRFKASPASFLKNHRARYVGAALTIMRAFILSGRPGVVDLTPFNGFDQWSNLVRGSLVWLGMPDPVLSMDELQTTDPDAELLSDLLTHWHELMGEGENSLRDVIHAAKADTRGDLQVVLEDIAGGAVRSDINIRRLAAWLQAQRGRVVDGLRVERSERQSAGAFKWRVRRVGQSKAEAA